MKIEIKSAIILISCLVIGILIGLLLDQTLIRWQFKQNMARVRHPQGMIFMMERIIQPKDEIQQKKIREVLDKHFQQFNKIQQNTRIKIAALMDSLQIELTPILTNEQNKRLAQRLERLKKFDKEMPPFPPGPGQKGPFGGFEEPLPVGPPPGGPLPFEPLE
jgi:hypothetical protein